MRTWRRAFMDERCGNCRNVIRRGEPLLEFSFPGVTRPKRRCTSCADYPVPDDLPPLAERVTIQPTAMMHIASGPGTLPLDFKTRQYEREPGCDDE